MIVRLVRREPKFDVSKSDEVWHMNVHLDGVTISFDTVHEPRPISPMLLVLEYKEADDAES